MKFEAQSVTKEYASLLSVFKDFSAKNPYDFQVMSLIGPSGGGKSTFLRMLGGLESFEGQISLNGEQVPKEGKTLLEWRRHHGFLFQSYNLFPHLNVLENIILPLTKIFNQSPEIAIQRASKLLKDFDLFSFKDRFPHTLSGGQQQRIALCRALVAEAQILFLDEPTAALDPQMSYEVLMMIEELKKKGKNIFFVTHSLSFAQKISDLVFFISPTLKKIGSVQELLISPKEQEVKEFLKYYI